GISVWPHPGWRCASFLGFHPQGGAGIGLSAGVQSQGRARGSLRLVLGVIGGGHVGGITPTRWSSLRGGETRWSSLRGAPERRACPPPGRRKREKGREAAQ